MRRRTGRRRRDSRRARRASGPAPARRGRRLGRTRRPARGCSRSCRRRRSRRGPSCEAPRSGGWGLRSCGCCSFGAISERGVAFERDQLLDPFEVVLGGLDPVLEERPGVAIGGAGGVAARLRQALRELRAPALEERDPCGRSEVAAERELQREGALVVVALVGEELIEELLARRRDAVRLARAQPGTRPPPDARRREIALEGTGRDDRGGRAVRLRRLDRTVALEAPERGI